MKFFKFWFPVILYSGIIFYGSSIPGTDAPMPFAHFDKVVHICEYLPYGFLVLRGLDHSLNGQWRGMLMFYAVLFVAFYGASDELHQMFVEGRTSSFMDLLVDIIGGWLGCQLYWLFYKNKRLLNEHH